MFSQLGLSPVVCSSLARLSHNTPTPIQTQAIPLVLTGVDLLARAQTGTGKTAAFGLPMIERFMTRGGAPRSQKPRGLVLVPTRELAVQVHAALAAYAVPANLRIAAIFGGVSMSGQIQALRRGPDIIVATPGRLIDHMERRTADLSGIEVLTLDEADRMLDMGFLPALRRVIKALPRDRQTLLFSATLPETIVRLSSEFMRNAVRVDVSGEQVVAAQVTHQVRHVALDRKRDALIQILMEDPQAQALVFCKTKRGANRVGESIEGQGVRMDVIHGNKSQNARNRALEDFKSGRVRVLVATDIAARGLDIARLPLVVNFDLPLVAEDYVHRIGRTGRAGLQGRAVSLVSPSDTGLLRDIQRVLKSPLEHVNAPAGGYVEATARAIPERISVGPRSAQTPPRSSERSARPRWQARPSPRRRPAGHAPGASATRSRRPSDFRD